tara:strand:+ start:4198 stop:4581 length:384 start_codon:yes stop_codon:yes gene_type:complete
MADLKISELTSLGALVANNDLLVVVDTNNSATKSIAISDLVGNIPSNTNITGDLVVSGNTSIQGTSLQLAKLTGTPTSNNATTVLGANPEGKLVWSHDGTNTYLYLAINNVDVDGSLKRMQFLDFAP